MTKSQSSSPSIVVPSIFEIRLVNGAQLLNDICVAGAVIALITKTR